MRRRALAIAPNSDRARYNLGDLELCELLIRCEEEPKAPTDLLRQRIQRESLLLSCNCCGKVAKHAEHHRRPMQNHRVLRAERYGPVQVRTSPDKVEPGDGTQEATSRVACG